MLTDIPGLRVGHVTDTVNLTGCTVALFDEPIIAGASQRGANSASAFMDYFRPEAVICNVRAIMLTGGSCFGLEAIFGAMRYLEENGIGTDVGGGARIPLVPGAVIFDLRVGNAHVRPDLAMGRLACENAKAGPFQTGKVGAGTGATVGKFFGVEQCSPGGLGTYTVELYDGILVSALVVVNAFGDVINPATQQIVAGTKNKDGSFADTYQLMKSGQQSPLIAARQNTTIGIISTNCELNRQEANRIAEIAHNGLAQAIRPIHTNVDGDTLFATGMKQSRLSAPLDVLATAATEAVAKACVHAVSHNSI